MYMNIGRAHIEGISSSPPPLVKFFLRIQPKKSIFLRSPPQTFSGFFLCKSFYDRICIPYAWHVKYEDNLSKKLTDKRDTSGAKIDIFLFLNSYLSIIFRTPMFLESPISTSNLPKSWKMNLRRYLPNGQPVLAKTPNLQPAKRICIIYMYVLSNSSIPVGDLANTGW